MAIFRLDIQSLGRTAGRSATNAAAYRAGERIRDERTGRTYDHTQRTDVLSKEIVLPAAFAGAEPAWSRDRSTLWNHAEAAEKRSNSRVAREYQVSLPAELSSEQRLGLTRAFARELADRYNVAVDMTIHAPREGGDPRAHHAHLLTTTREVTAEGLGRKASLELGDKQRQERGLVASSEEYKAVRERWAALTNQALREAHIDARVDHRSLAAQGVDREPGPSIPHRFFAMERQGIRTTVGEQIRENWRRRVEAHAVRTLQASNEPQNPKRVSLEEVRAGAVQAWLQYRERQRAPTAEASKEVGLARDAQNTTASERKIERTRDDDYSL
jgi:ATP-dependent exoDNAse (exonuclease V) alpha subunit